ncbi:hypothetical protein VTO73DRAFT_4564 [Trametes versicolor]
MPPTNSDTVAYTSGDGARVQPFSITSQWLQVKNSGHGSVVALSIAGSRRGPTLQASSTPAEDAARAY